MSPLSLPDKAKHLVSETDEDEIPKTSIDLFTCVKWTGRNWKIHQEIEGKVVPGSEGSIPKNKNPLYPEKYFENVNQFLEPDKRRSTQRSPNASGVSLSSKQSK